MSIYSCDNNLSVEDLIGLVVMDDGSGNLYLNVYDSGVDYSTLDDLDCLHNLSLEDILRMLVTLDNAGNPAIRAIKIS